MDAYVHLSGNVGGAVEFRKRTDELDAWATFRLAHTPSYRRGDSWVDLPTTWLTVNCRRMLASNVDRSLHSGDPVIVSGRLRTRTWVDEETKQTREQLVVEADSVGPDLARGVSTFQRNPRKDTDQESGASPVSAGNRPVAEDPWRNIAETTDAEAGIELDSDAVAPDAVLETVAG